MENSEVKIKCILLTVPSRKIQVSQTRSQFMYTALDSKESGTTLPPVQVGYTGRVVWCRRVTAEREHDVINHKSPVACGCRAGSQGQFEPMVRASSRVRRDIQSCLWVHPSDIRRVISLTCFLRSGVADVLHPGTDRRTPLFLSFSLLLMAGWRRQFRRGNQ
jgi:hypothetical protein